LLFIEDTDTFAMKVVLAFALTWIRVRGKATNVASGFVGDLLFFSITFILKKQSHTIPNLKSVSLPLLRRRLLPRHP
jgi:hypothetical protein